MVLVKGVVPEPATTKADFKKGKREMTKEFIKEVLSVPSCSSKETKLREYIERFADGRGIVHQTLPIIIRERMRDGHTELYAGGGGIGADDKLGCAIALALVDVLPVAKAVFFVEEELGMLGSRELDVDWFGDVGFCLSFDSPDRNRASRTCSGRLLYSDGFFGEILQPICARHGVTRFNAEPFTDVTQVRAKTNVMCFNVGNGGRLAHSPSEYLVVEDAQSAYALGKELLEAVGTRQHWFQ